MYYKMLNSTLITLCVFLCSPIHASNLLSIEQTNENSESTSPVQSSILTVWDKLEQLHLQDPEGQIVATNADFLNGSNESHYIPDDTGLLEQLAQMRSQYPKIKGLQIGTLPHHLSSYNLIYVDQGFACFRKKGDAVRFISSGRLGDCSLLIVFNREGHGFLMHMRQANDPEFAQLEHMLDRFSKIAPNFDRYLIGNVMTPTQDRIIGFLAKLNLPLTGLYLHNSSLTDYSFFSPTGEEWHSISDYYRQHYKVKEGSPCQIPHIKRLELYDPTKYSVVEKDNFSLSLLDVESKYRLQRKDDSGNSSWLHVTFDTMTGVIYINIDTKEFKDSNPLFGKCEQESMQLNIYDSRFLVPIDTKSDLLPRYTTNQFGPIIDSRQHNQ